MKGGVRNSLLGGGLISLGEGPSSEKKVEKKSGNVGVGGTSSFLRARDPSNVG